MSGAPRGLLVGIDIGMTCTGVAIVANDDVKVIQKWPGSIEIINKVPTKVTYTAGEKGMTAWGCECPAIEKLHQGMATKDMFKFCLNPVYLEIKFETNPDDAPKVENVSLWYEDFLCALYLHIIDYIRLVLGIDPNLTSFEFTFSIPTSWKDDDHLVLAFRELVKLAGFDGRGSVIMELTEGEACAVFTANKLQKQFQKGEAFMVCDAGGGTTDMCILQVERVEEGILKLENLMNPEALAIGSVDIDELFKARAEEKLKALGGISEREASILAHQITQGEFQALKHEFETDLVSELKVASLPVPNSGHRIELSPHELQAMFDEQIQKIINFIDERIVSLRGCRPDIELSYLFLAGGLGSSKYVQDVMAKHCKNLKVLFAPEPTDLPLAVCKGLVIDRLQHYSHNLPVIPIRSSNSSYGILCREIYDKQRSDKTQPHSRSPLDREKYVEKQIDWLVYEDNRPLRGECVTKNYSLVLDASNTTHKWGFSVVRSTLEPDKALPTFLDGTGGAMVICHVTATTEADLRDKVSKQRRTLMGMGKKCISSRVDCELSAIIGAGKMEFTVRIKADGDTYSTPQKLEVKWEEIPRPTGGGINSLIRDL